MNPFFNMYPNQQNQPNMYQQFNNMYNSMPQNNQNGMGFNPFIYQQFMNQNYMNMNNNNNVQQLFQMFLQWMNNYNNNNNNYNFNNQNNQYYQNMNNNNFNANGGNNNINNEAKQPVKETIPRPKEDKMLIIDNEYIEDMENLKNVIFLASSGFKVLIKVPYYETVENLFKLFARKIGIGENTLGKDIFFIFDASYLQVNDKRAIYEITQASNPTITVIDSGNVLGAK
jgi:hypothetical protein